MKRRSLVHAMSERSEKGVCVAMERKAGMFFERLLEDAENGLTITARELPACLPMPLRGAGRAPEGNAIPPCVGQSRGSRPLLGERAEAAISLATEQGFPHWRARGVVLRGWALVQQGQVKEGIEQIHLGLTTYRATGAELSRPYFLALLAEAHGVMGQPEAGLTVLAEALALTDAMRGRWYEPDLYHLKGELLLQLSSDNQAEAENCFQQAIAIAQNQ